MIGKTVGKYRIVDRLGRGGMGTVYKAVDETLDREVAIKVLNPDLGETDVLKRFRAEAVTLARLNHPGIATLYELHRQDDELLMVMEFVRGETFHDLSERLGSLAPPQAAHLCMQVLDALAHAHRAGVVHRDLKPANLMVTENGSVKVMDFGIARVLGTEHFTHGGYMMGTPAYMAPEQVLGSEVDGRADLYAVGVVLYRLLTAQLPFEADTAIAMVQKQISDAPTPVATFRPNLPQWCSTVIDRALQKKPADRFQTAEQFRSALSSAAQPQTLGELPTIATPAPPGLPRDPDLTTAYEAGWPDSTVAGRVRQTDTSRIVAPAQGQTATAHAAAPRTGPAPASLDRTTGTTVVLGRPHLVALGALFVVLAIGIAVLGFAATRRGSFQQQLPLLGTQPQLSTQAAPSTPSSAGSEAGSVADSSATGSDVAATAGAGPAQPTGSAPLAQGAARPPAQRTAAEAIPGDPAARNPGVTPAASDGASAPAPPAKAINAAAAFSFEGIRVLVPDTGDRARERQAVLQLGGGRLTVVDQAGGAIAALPYKAIDGVFYSRSRQPRWRDAAGKEVESKVDLGRLGFFRGDRNWLILLTKSEPLIIRLDDEDLKTVLPAVQEQTGIAIQR